MSASQEDFKAHLAKLSDRYTEVEHRLAEEAGKPGSQEYLQLSKELTHLSALVQAYRTYLM